MSRVTTRDLPLSSTLILVCIQTKFDVIPVQNFQLPVKGNFKIWPFTDRRTVATGARVGGGGGGVARPYAYVSFTVSFVSLSFLTRHSRHHQDDPGQQGCTCPFVLSP